MSSQDDIDGYLRHWTTDVTFSQYENKSKEQLWLELSNVFDSFSSDDIKRVVSKHEFLVAILFNYCDLTTLQRTPNIWLQASFCIEKCLVVVGDELLVQAEIDSDDFCDSMFEILHATKSFTPTIPSLLNTNNISYLKDFPVNVMANILVARVMINKYHVSTRNVALFSSYTIELLNNLRRYPMHVQQTFCDSISAILYREGISVKKLFSSNRIALLSSKPSNFLPIGGEFFVKLCNHPYTISSVKIIGEIFRSHGLFCCLAVPNLLSHCLEKKKPLTEQDAAIFGCALPILVSLEIGYGRQLEALTSLLMSMLAVDWWRLPDHDANFLLECLPPLLVSPHSTTADLTVSLLHSLQYNSTGDCNGPSTAKGDEAMSSLAPSSRALSSCVQSTRGLLSLIQGLSSMYTEFIKSVSYDNVKVLDTVIVPTLHRLDDVLASCILVFGLDPLHPLRREADERYRILFRLFTDHRKVPLSVSLERAVKSGGGWSSASCLLLASNLEALHARSKDVRSFNALFKPNTSLSYAVDRHNHTTNSGVNTSRSEDGVWSVSKPTGAIAVDGVRIPPSRSTSTAKPVLRQTLLPASFTAAAPMPIDLTGDSRIMPPPQMTSVTRVPAATSEAPQLVQRHSGSNNRLLNPKSTSSGSVSTVLAFKRSRDNANSFGGGFLNNVQDLRPAKRAVSSSKSCADESESRKRLADWTDFGDEDAPPVAARKFISGLNEGYSDPAALDEGYENLLPAPQPDKSSIRSTGIDLSALLRQATSSVSRPVTSRDPLQSGQAASSVKGLAAKYASGPNDLLEDESLDKVCIDSLLKSVLRLKLADLSEEPETKNGINCTLNSVPNRFLEEEHYMNTFRPLLLEEVKAALGNHVRTGGGLSSGGRHGGVHSAARVVDVRCALLHDRQGDAELQEARVALIKSEGRGTVHGELDKDDLILVFQSTSPEDSSPPSREESLAAAIKRPHALAIVTSALKGGGQSQQAQQQYSQQSLLLLKGSTPSTSEPWTVVPVMGLSTYLREWAAVHSVQCHRLMPLSPYILKAAPVVSSGRLSYLNKELKLQLVALTREDQSLDIHTKARSVALVLESLSAISATLVDGSVLRRSGVGRTITEIAADKTLDTSVRKAASDLKAGWKLQVKSDNNSKTVSSLRGGNLVEVPTTAVPCPGDIPAKLWQTLQSSYNPSQLFAIKYVSDVSESQDTRIALVQGPPGTGKTSTVLGMVAVLLHRKRSTDNASAVGNAAAHISSNSHARLLICAPSNAAVDEILSRLMDGVLSDSGRKRKVKLVRLGRPLEGGSEATLALTLENQVEAIAKADSAWTHLVEAEQAMHSIQSKLRQSGAEASGSGRALRQELSHARGKKVWAEMSLDRVRTDARRQLLSAAEVVVCTLSASGQQQIIDHISEFGIVFDICIVDEAAQTTEPSTLIPLRYGCRRLVLVGDPRQLPATVLSPPAEAAGLAVSLFERLERAGHEVVMLTVQHRMHPEIRMFPSAQFYNNRLTDAPSITSEVELQRSSGVLPAGDSLVSLDFSQMPHLAPLKFFDLSSSEERSGKSFKNSAEVSFIASLLESLANALTGLSLAVITPYKAQVHCLKRSFANLPPALLSTVEVNSVDGFQGREKDVVIFSCVRTARNIGFVSDERRMNVAITRARRCLVLVGSSASLQFDDNWGALIRHLRSMGRVRAVPGSSFADLNPSSGDAKPKVTLLEDGQLPEESSRQSLTRRPVRQGRSNQPEGRTGRSRVGEMTAQDATTKAAAAAERPVVHSRTIADGRGRDAVRDSAGPVTPLPSRDPVLAVQTFTTHRDHVGSASVIANKHASILCPTAATQHSVDLDSKSVKGKSSPPTSYKIRRKNLSVS